MERWNNRVAVVTGASSGIGAAIAKALVQHGMQVVGLARRDDNIKELAAELGNAPGKLHAVKCDLRKEEDILAAFKWVKDKLGGVDVLVNNAGAFGDSNLSEAPTEEMRMQLEVNVLALSICTREAVRDMRERGASGHIIHINSIAGHIPPFKLKVAFYSATKHAVTALTEGLRKDLVAHKDNIKVTSISPGMVETEMLASDPKRRAELVKTLPVLTADDIANAAVYTLGTPPHVQVHEIIIKPTGEQV